MNKEEVFVVSTQIAEKSIEILIDAARSAWRMADGSKISHEKAAELMFPLCKALGELNKEAFGRYLIDIGTVDKA